MRSTGSSTVEAGQRPGVVGDGDRVADLDLGEPGDDEQVTGHELVDLVAADAPEGHQVGQAPLQRRLALGRSPPRSSATVSPRRSTPLHDPPDGEATEVVGGVEVGDEGLERRSRSPDGGGTVARMVSSSAVRSSSGPASPTPATARPSPRDGRHDREVELVGVGGQVDEELLDLVEHLVRAGVAAVDLVDHDHGGQVEGEGLGQHVAGLGQRALGRVDQQQDAVDHGQRPLDLAAEVGVARACRRG